MKIKAAAAILQKALEGPVVIELPLSSGISVFSCRSRLHWLASKSPSKQLKTRIKKFADKVEMTVEFIPATEFVYTEGKFKIETLD